MSLVTGKNETAQASRFLIALVHLCADTSGPASSFDASVIEYKRQQRSVAPMMLFPKRRVHTSSPNT